MGLDNYFPIGHCHFGLACSNYLLASSLLEAGRLRPVQPSDPQAMINGRLALENPHVTPEKHWNGARLAWQMALDVYDWLESGIYIYMCIHTHTHTQRERERYISIYIYTYRNLGSGWYIHGYTVIYNFLDT